MAQNGPNDHFGQNDLIPNRILAFGRQNGPKLGNGRNTVSRVLFRKRELTEFCGKLGELCVKLGEFALAHK